MGVLARQEEVDGRWLVWIVTDGLNTMMVDTDHELTEAEAQVILDGWNAQQVTNGSTD